MQTSCSMLSAGAKRKVQWDPALPDDEDDGGAGPGAEFAADTAGDAALAAQLAEASSGDEEVGYTTFVLCKGLRCSCLAETEKPLYIRMCGCAASIGSTGRCRNPASLAAKPAAQLLAVWQHRHRVIGWTCGFTRDPSFRRRRNGRRSMIITLAAPPTTTKRGRRPTTMRQGLPTKTTRRGR